LKRKTPLGSASLITASTHFPCLYEITGSLEQCFRKIPMKGKYTPLLTPFACRSQNNE